MSQISREDQRHLHRILEGLRFASIIILLLHYYTTICAECQTWQQGNPIVDRMLSAVTATAPFDDPIKTKAVALGLLVVSLIGARGKRSPDYTAAKGLGYLLPGL